MILPLLGNTLLRTAITRNLVTFPSQIQPFMKRSNGDLPERIVQLYFVRGWTIRSICARYGLGKAMVHKLLAEWRVRAIESGYIQEIEPGCLSALQVEERSGSAAATKLGQGKVDRATASPAPENYVLKESLSAALSAPGHLAALSAARSLQQHVNNR